MHDRGDIVHENFLRRVRDGDLPATTESLSPAQAGLSAAQVIEIFESQVLSRHLDNHSRKLQARGEGFYTIGSSGHEGNAAVAAALRLEDMAFLHYRDAAFFIQRSKKLPGQTPAYDLLLSFTASRDDPISGGRHKVLGSKALWIPPQTSTIASHLPKAVGTAYSIDLARRLRRPGPLPGDALVLCSFGDASANHSTSQGAFNSAAWTAYQNVPLPLIFLCEDNGLGISTPTPQGWIRASFSHRPGLSYFYCDGLNILDTYRVSRELAAWVRQHRRPAFLHMSCVRLFGHAGPDAQNLYLSDTEIEAMETRDPLLYSAGLLIRNGLLDAGQILKLYTTIQERVLRVAEAAVQRPKLKTVAEVAHSLVPARRRQTVPAPASAAQRKQVFGDDLRIMRQPQHMARLLSWALADLMLEHGDIVIAGEDIGPKGGVYTVTSKLSARFGHNRVINTLLDEQSILGLAIGLAHNGLLPIPEIQFLAYLHNAEDQVRGEAATLSFFSQGQYTNPMIIRIAGLAYQKGFGGHFHNDNSLAVLRDIPGLVIACPSNGADAVEMLRECARLAREEQRVVVFLEPIALYMTRDLHEPKDGRWAGNYRSPEDAVPIRCGDVGVYGEGTDLCIISYGNGYYLARQAGRVLEQKHGMGLRIIDLRWLSPLDEDRILEAIAPCTRVLIVDECRRTGSQSEGLYTLISERAPGRPLLSRLTAEDCFIPLGRAATVTLPSRDSIVAAAVELRGRNQ